MLDLVETLENYNVPKNTIHIIITRLKNEVELKDKLHRRNMQIKELKFKIETMRMSENGEFDIDFK